MNYSVDSCRNSSNIYLLGGKVKVGGELGSEKKQSGSKIERLDSFRSITLIMKVLQTTLAC